MKKPVQYDESNIQILEGLMSYLYGSVPFALVVGKLFYNTDVRESGSGNLGGTNAGSIKAYPIATETAFPPLNPANIG